MDRRWVIGLFLVATSGCFAFTEATVASPGETARVTLGVTRRVGERDEAIRVEGLVVSSTLGLATAAPGVISLEQRSTEHIGNFREYVTFDTVYVAAPDMQRLEIRHFSWFRSTIGAAIFGGLVYVLYDRFAPRPGVFGG